MKDFQIIEESLPSRCEICHQDDCFNPQTNFCSRCQNVPAVVAKTKINSVNSINSTNPTTITSGSIDDKELASWRLILAPVAVIGSIAVGIWGGYRSSDSLLIGIIYGLVMGILMGAIFGSMVVIGNLAALLCMFSGMIIGLIISSETGMFLGGIIGLLFGVLVVDTIFKQIRSHHQYLKSIKAHWQSFYRRCDK